MSQHETRFGVLMTPEADPFSRAKRFIKRINEMSDEEYEKDEVDLTMEWLRLSRHLSNDQLVCLAQLWRTAA